MKNKKSDRIECYDTTAVLKNLFLLSQKLLDRFEQVIIADKKVNLQKPLGDGHGTILSNFKKSYLIWKINFLIF